MKKKRRAKRKKIPGATTALALATKLGLREHKGMKGVESMTDAEFYALSEDEQHAALQKALRTMPGLEEAVARKMGHPTTKGPGLYDAHSGAMIYPDSVSIVAYIGSEQEERDAQLAKGPLKALPAKKTGATCVKCFGWGCLACDGWGST